MTLAIEILLVFHCVRSIVIISLFKRLVDYFAAILMLIVLTPILIVIAIAIKLDSPGKILFKQTRVGLNEKHFKIWKFRTMVMNSEDLQQELEDLNEIEGGLVFKIRNDPRIIRISEAKSSSFDQLKFINEEFLNS